jgi:hypothetical protein
MEAIVFAVAAVCAALVALAVEMYLGGMRARRR